MNDTPQLRMAGYPLWLQLAAALLLIFLVASLIGGYIIRKTQSSTLEETFRDSGNRVASLIAASALDAIISEDRPILETVVSGTGKMDPYLLSIVIANEDGQVLASWHDPAPPTLEEDMLEAEHNVEESGETFGRIRLAFDLRESRRTIEDNVRLLNRVLLATLALLSLMVFVTIALLVTRPISRLTDRLRSLAQQDFDTEAALPIGAARELVLLDDAVLQLRSAMVERIRRESDLEEARNRAEAASHAKDQFLANMSHEIRTPMNGIIGVADLLAETGLSDDQTSLNDMVRSSGEQLLEILNDILDFSKIESGMLEIEEGPFSLVDALEISMASVVPSASEKSLELACDIDPALPPAMIGDRIRLRQVVTNLLTNAVKFTTEGEILLRAYTRGEGDPKLIIEVSDTGPGIPESHQERLFDSFTQLDASTTRKHGGTGLGLAISRRLTELMGGTLGLASTPGKGSTFSVVIPWRPAEDTADTEDKGTPEEMAMLVGKRVLIVDDNTTTRRILTLHCESLGMETVSASSGTIALAGLRKDADFDLAIVDMLMPGMDGIELSGRLREHFSDQGIKILLATSLWKLPSKEDGSGFPFDAHLFKPIRRSQFTRTLIQVFAPHPGEPLSPTPPISPAGDGMLPAPGSIRILVAEDNPTNLKVASRLLGRLGYQTDSASNGIEATRLSQETPYDLIFMDVQMPEMDGFEATARIRAQREDAPHPRPMIVAMTANALKGDRERCLEAGMDDYISKPIRLDKLAAAISGILPLRPDLDASPPPATGETHHRPIPGDQLIDPGQIQQVAEIDKDSGGQIYKGFTGSTANALWRLSEHLQRAEWEDARELALELKGVASNIGFRALATGLARVETLTRKQDLEGAAQSAAGLEELFLRSREEAEKHL